MLIQRHAPGLKDMRSQHTDAEREADKLRQRRAAEREQAERRFDERLRLAQKNMKIQTRKGPRLEI